MKKLSLLLLAGTGLATSVALEYTGNTSVISDPDESCRIYQDNVRNNDFTLATNVLSTYFNPVSGTLHINIHNRDMISKDIRYLNAYFDIDTPNKHYTAQTDFVYYNGWFLNFYNETQALKQMTPEEYAQNYKENKIEANGKLSIYRFKEPYSIFESLSISWALAGRTSESHDFTVGTSLTCNAEVAPIGGWKNVKSVKVNYTPL